MGFFLYIFIILLIFATFVEAFVSEVIALTEGNAESLILPYTVFNNEGRAEEQFKHEYKNDWLLSIKNNLTYIAASPDSSIVLLLKDDAQSQEYIRLAMDGKNKMSIELNFRETGYLSISSNGKNSWSMDKPLILLFSEANGGELSISNGVRTLADRLNVGKFSIRTIEFYGSSSSPTTDVASNGNVKLEITSGRPISNNSLIFLLLFAGIGAAVLFSVRGIKRNKDSWQGKRKWSL